MQQAQLHQQQKHSQQRQRLPLPEPSPMHPGDGWSSSTLFIHPFHSKSQFFHSTRLPTPSAPSRGWAGILLLPQGTSVHDALHGRLIITSLLPLPLQVGTAQYGDHFPFQLAPAHGAVISAVLGSLSVVAQHEILIVRQCHWIGHVVIVSGGTIIDVVL